MEIEDEKTFDSKIVQFYSYEEYYGKHIYPTVIKTGTVAFLIILVYILREFFLKQFSLDFSNYLRGYLLGSIFLGLMILGAYRKKIKEIIIFGNISATILCGVNIFVELSPTSIFHIIFMFMFGVIIVAPILSIKVFLNGNLITNIFITIFLLIKNVGFEDFSKIMLFSLTSTFFLVLILKYLKENAENIYRVNKENFYYSNLDMLSCLLNRRAWYSKAEKLRIRASKKGKSITFMMMDIDYFKKINDTWGHDCGDMVIKEVSKAILNKAPKDCEVGRLGGEEFGIIIKGLNCEEAEKLAENIREDIEYMELNYMKNKIKITLSIGVVFCEKENLDNIVKIGDECLYKAKNSGRNRVVLKVV